MGLHKSTSQPQQQGPFYKPFSALTASTQLTALHLQEGWTVPIPQAAFEHMFSLGYVLPHLKELYIICESVRKPCVDVGQIAMIAASCPALQQLRLRGATPERFDVSCLAQLPPGVTEVKGCCWTRLVPQLL
jgi:hypothetical protein